MHCKTVISSSHVMSLKWCWEKKQTFTEYNKERTKETGNNDGCVSPVSQSGVWSRNFSLLLVISFLGIRKISFVSAAHEVVNNQLFSCLLTLALRYLFTDLLISDLIFNSFSPAISFCRWLNFKTRKSNHVLVVGFIKHQLRIYINQLVWLVWFITKRFKCMRF